MKQSLLLSLVFLCSTTFAADLFTGVTEDLGKCFSREYTAEELAKNPGQKVKTMAAKLFLDVNYYEEEKFVTPLIKIQATAKGSDRVYGATLACLEDGQCFIDCDGPRVKVRYSTNNPGSLLIDNSESALTLSALECGDEEMEAVSLWLDASTGDDLFLLKPMPAWQCL